MTVRIELDASTGEIREIKTTAYVVAGARVFVDEGDPVPQGAVLASSLPVVTQAVSGPDLSAAQVARLVAFLKANPDIVKDAKL